MNLSIGLVIPEKTPSFPFSTSFDALAKKSSPIPSPSSGSSSRFFVTCRSTSPGERTRSEAFSEGGATRETVEGAGSRDGAATGAGAVGGGGFCEETDGTEAGDTPGAGAAGTAAGTPGATVAGGAALEATAGPGDFPAFKSSEGIPAPTAADVGTPSPVPPKDGITVDKRRNPATARAPLTSRPPRLPPGKQYKLA